MADNVTNHFRSVPMRQLIGQPFAAACDSNILLAEAMFSYLNRVAYVDGDETQTRLLNFNLQQPYTDQSSNTLSLMDINVKAPFIGLAPIPSLLIDNVTVDFTMKVESVDSLDTTDNTVKVLDKKGDRLSVNTTLTTDVNRVRSTNQEASYTVHAQANQQPQTEGLSKLMDIMANCIAPISA